MTSLKYVPTDGEWDDKVLGSDKVSHQCHIRQTTSSRPVSRLWVCVNINSIWRPPLVRKVGPSGELLMLVGHDHRCGIIGT